MKPDIPHRSQFKINSPSRNVTSKLLILLVFTLMLLPFWTIFQDVLTNLVLKFKIYAYIQDIVVPYQLSVVGVVLRFIGLPIRFGLDYFEWTKDGSSVFLTLVWNCIGWQTAILCLVSCMVGLSGKHTLLSKIEALVFGIVGTYIINNVRLVLVVCMFYFFGNAFGNVFHTYFSSVISLMWLVGFWWYSVYQILVERHET